MADVLIIGASGGIGSALARSYRDKGDTVRTLSRRDDGLDITNQDSVAQSLDGLGAFDRVIIATGALEINEATPEKSIKSINADAMADQFTLNAIGPALVLSHAHTLLARDRPSVCAVLSARVGSIGDNRLGGWISYRAAKAALNQIVCTSAIELRRSHKQAALVALHPGTVATRFTEKYVGRHPAVSPEVAAQNMISVLDNLQPADTGRFLDYAGKDIAW
ncbi:MAG: SDR family NAD(P)-dependent oxidoreductase [Paracoccaceae bacterium]